MLDAEAALATAEARAGVVPADGAAAIAPPARSTLYDADGWPSAGARSATRSSRSCARCAHGRRGGRALRAPRRDEPGHHGHRRDARRAPRARARARRARPASPRACARAGRAHRDDADGRPHAPAAGRADDVRAEGGRLARSRSLEARARLAAARRAASPPSSAARPARWRRSATTGSSRAGSSPTSSGSPSRRCPGTRTARRSPSSARRSAIAAGAAREDRRSTSCCSRRPRSARCAEAARAAAPRRCRRSATRSASTRRPRVRAARRAHAQSCSGALGRSTSARPAPGRRSGRRSPARSVHGRRAPRPRTPLDGLEVDADRMRANLDATGGLVSPSAFASLAPTGPAAAHESSRDARVGRSRSRCALGDERAGLAAASSTPLLDPADVSRLRPRRSSTARSRATRGARRERLHHHGSTGRTDAPVLVLSTRSAPTHGAVGAAAAGARRRVPRAPLRPAAATAARPCPGRYTVDDLGADVARPARRARRRAGRRSAALSLGGMVGMWLGAATRRSGSTGSSSAAPRRRFGRPAAWHERAATVRAEGLGRARRRRRRPLVHAGVRAGSRSSSTRSATMLAATPRRGLRRAAARRSPTSTLRDRLAAITAPTLVDRRRRRPGDPARRTPSCSPHGIPARG